MSDPPPPPLSQEDISTHTYLLSITSTIYPSTKDADFQVLVGRTDSGFSAAIVSTTRDKDKQPCFGFLVAPREGKTRAEAILGVIGVLEGKAMKQIVRVQGLEKLADAKREREEKMKVGGKGKVEEASMSAGP
jgi:hypothetical protein